MAYCYRIPYTDRFGTHEATKWGDTPNEAIGFLQNALSGRGCGAATIGTPEPVNPQPFGAAMPVPQVVARTETPVPREADTLVLI